MTPQRRTILVASLSVTIGAIAIFLWLVAWTQLIGMRWLAIRDFAGLHLGVTTRDEVIAFSFALDVVATALPFFAIGWIAGWASHRDHTVIIVSFLLGVFGLVLIQLAWNGMLAWVWYLTTRPVFWAAPLFAIVGFAIAGRLRKWRNAP
jgi:hypothetical protein